MLKNEIKTTNEIKEFTKICVFDEYAQEFEKFKMYWEQAESVDDFKKLVFADSELKLTQGYAALSKESDGHWYRVREMFGDRQFKTESDGGGVLVGNESCQIHVSNGHGDGTSRVAIFKNGEINDNMMVLHPTSINVLTSMNIYSHDSGPEDVVATLEKGTYFTYSYEGFVAFVKIN